MEGGVRAGGDEERIRAKGGRDGEEDVGARPVQPRIGQEMAAVRGREDDREIARIEVEDDDATLEVRAPVPLR